MPGKCQINNKLWLICEHKKWLRRSPKDVYSAYCVLCCYAIGILVSFKWEFAQSIAMLKVLCIIVYICLINIPVYIGLLRGGPRGP